VTIQQFFVFPSPQFTLSKKVNIYQHFNILQMFKKRKFFLEKNLTKQHKSGAQAHLQTYFYAKKNKTG